MEFPISDNDSGSPRAVTVCETVQSLPGEVTPQNWSNHEDQPLRARDPPAVLLLGTTLLGQTNPVPFVTQPLIPTTVAPGSAGFMLTVNGTGFVSGSVVNWNGSPRTTTFVSSSQLTSSVSSSDVAAVSTASVSVTSPNKAEQTPAIFFQITAATSSISLGKADYATGETPLGVATADFNRDGNLDIVTGNSSSGTVSVLLGKGGGTFQTKIDSPSCQGAYTVVAADFNNDGKADLAIACESVGVGVQLGNGDGTFQTLQEYPGFNAKFLAVGDFNGDGLLDIAADDDNTPGNVEILLGNGDGTFQTAVSYPAGDRPFGVAVGDFNGDGRLDLAVTNYAANTISILLGNGDGSFQSHVDYPASSSPFLILTGDFNGDGKLDLAVSNQNSQTVSVFLGNGNGTFKGRVDYRAASGTEGIVAGDFNGDGRLDLAVANCGANNISVLLGNGDGIFQSELEFAANHFPSAIATGDFNKDGRLDFAVGYTSGTPPSFAMSVFLQTPLTLSSNSVSFGSQNVGTTSSPQLVTLTNTGAAAVNLAAIIVTGNFAETNNCPVGGILKVAASCSVSVTFTPTTTGTRLGALTITDSANNSPQVVSLTGTGVGPVASFSATKLTFVTQVVYTTSKPEIVILTNLGTGTLTITSIAISGTNATDFTQTNTCGNSVGVGASCTISVRFTPSAKGTRTAAITVTDNANPSPQTISIYGTGTVVSLSSPSLTFPPTRVGMTSQPLSVTVTNVGATSLNFTNIGIGGKNPGDFAQTNTCGTSIAGGARCTISVRFAPQAKGLRSSSISIADNGGGSPQKVTLSGTGQ